MCQLGRQTQLTHSLLNRLSLQLSLPFYAVHAGEWSDPDGVWQANTASVERRSAAVLRLDVVEVRSSADRQQHIRLSSPRRRRRRLRGRCRSRRPPPSLAAPLPRSQCMFQSADMVVQKSGHPRNGMGVRFLDHPVYAKFPMFYEHWKNMAKP